MSRERLADVLIEFARTLVSGYDPSDILYRLCDRVVDVLSVTGAGVMLTDEHGDLRFVSASDDVVRAIEALQIELGEGPCLHACRTGQQVVVPDLTDTDLFPRFSQRALERGMAAVYSFPMRIDEQRIGALNLYRDQAGPFSDEDAEAGQVLADVATMYVLNARALEERTRLAEQLQEALDSRVVIEQAKGVVAEQLGCGIARSFELLRRAARNEGRRIHDVAAEVVAGDRRLRP